MDSIPWRHPMTFISQFVVFIGKTYVGRFLLPSDLLLLVMLVWTCTFFVGWQIKKIFSFCSEVVTYRKIFWVVHLYSVLISLCDKEYEAGKGFQIKFLLGSDQICISGYWQEGYILIPVLQTPTSCLALPVKKIVSICCLLSWEWAALGIGMVPNDFVEWERGNLNNRKTYSWHSGKVFILNLYCDMRKEKDIWKSNRRNIRSFTHRKFSVSNTPAACGQIRSKSLSPSLKWRLLCYTWLSYWASSRSGISFSISFSSCQSQEIFAI